MKDTIANSQQVWDSTEGWLGEKVQSGPRASSSEAQSDDPEPAGQELRDEVDDSVGDDGCIPCAPIALEADDHNGADGEVVSVSGDDDGFGVEPVAAQADGDGGDQGGVVTVGGDDLQPSGDTVEPTSESPRYNRVIALGFVAVTVVASLVVGGTLVVMRHRPHTDDQDRAAHPSTQVSIVAAPTTTAGAAASGPDAAIPYSATAVGCLPGSTAAQSVAGTDPTQAWVCVHGGIVGQHLVLNLGRTMVITGVSITPGWVGSDASGADQWLQHQVIKRLQWSFNDSPPTVVPQETHAVHGEAPQALPGRGVLASRIILLVLETGRAPAETAPTSTPNPTAGSGGLLGEVLGPTPAGEASPTPTASLPADQSNTDPADNTFAVSSIRIFGHPPQ